MNGLEERGRGQESVPQMGGGGEREEFAKAGFVGRSTTTRSKTAIKAKQANPTPIITS